MSELKDYFMSQIVKNPCKAPPLNTTEYKYAQAMKGCGWMSYEDVAQLVHTTPKSAFEFITEKLCKKFPIEFVQRKNPKGGRPVTFFRWDGPPRARLDEKVEFLKLKKNKFNEIVEALIENLGVV